VRHSGFAWKPPAARTTALALTSVVLPARFTTTPCTPASSAMSDTARAEYQISMPFFFAICVSESTSPGPPRSLPGKPAPELEPPSILNACRPQAAVKRRPSSASTGRSGSFL